MTVLTNQITGNYSSKIFNYYDSNQEIKSRHSCYSWYRGQDV